MLSSAVVVIASISMLIGGMGNNALTPVGQWFAEVLPPIMDAIEPFATLSS